MLTALVMIGSVFSPAVALANGIVSPNAVTPNSLISPNAVTAGPPKPLPAAELQVMRQKLTRYNAWAATRATVGPKCPSVRSVAPQIICSHYYEVAGGGEYIQEPWDQPNWCAPGAATAVMMHWNYYAVVNYSTEYNVPRDPGFGGGTESYNGGQGWMAWFAVHMWIDWPYYRSGVMDQPYYRAGANEYVVAKALNYAINSDYYHIVNTSSTADMVGKTSYDITVDGRPVDYFANAQYLPEWQGHGVTGQLNHSIEVYAFDNSTHNYNVDSIFYADTASAADGAGIAGDWRDNQNHMWSQVLKSSAASGDITW